MASVVNGIKNIWGMFNMNERENDEEYEEDDDLMEEMDDEETEVRSIFGGRKKQ